MADIVFSFFCAARQTAPSFCVGGAPSRARNGGIAAASVP